MTRDMQDVPGFVETFRIDPPLPQHPWLDCDTSPPLRSRYSRRKKLSAVIKEAMSYIAETREGQIGIYASAFGGPFYGYVIKRPNGQVEFEPAEVNNDDE